MAIELQLGQVNFEPCFCVGPQNGEPHCPCVMRQRQAQRPGLGVMDLIPQKPPQEGWICPRCKTVNAPSTPTCFNALCKPTPAAA